MLPTVAALAVLFAQPPGASTVCATCVKAHVETLASPAFNGRRCATADEAKAADYLVAEFKRMGVQGGLAGGGLLQTVPLSTTTFTAPATLQVGSAAPLAEGDAFIARRGAESLSGPLVRLSDAKAATPPSLAGAVVFYDPATPDPSAQRVLARSGAKAILTVAPPAMLARWAQMKPDRGPTTIGGEPSALTPGPLAVMLKPEAAAAFRTAAAGATVTLAAHLGPPEKRATHNVVAVIRGSAADADRNTVLLSAHYDHLGVRDGKLYPGADDDASGTAAVLEMARALSAGIKPTRTVFFALFGCEEEGGFGATWFDRHTPVPIETLKANIEFEMIGLPDPQHPKLMMTGYERSNLGPTLAEHGANIEQDPYPSENFFQRSDNYALARVGVVAHTISAWPTPPTYHQPTDTASSVDYPFMARSIESLIGPIRWLVSGDFTPAWNPGGKPQG